jgi:hypothetical protein
VHGKCACHSVELMDTWSLMRRNSTPVGAQHTLAQQGLNRGRCRSCAFTACVLRTGIITGGRWVLVEWTGKRGLAGGRWVLVEWTGKRGQLADPLTLTPTY